VSGSFDETYYLGTEAEHLFDIGGVGFPEHNITRKWSQELRLSIPLVQWVDWLLGAFYTHEKTQADGGFVLEDPVTFEPRGEVLFQQLGIKYQEYTAFTDLTFKLSDAFDIQLGGREGRNRQTFDQVETYPYPPGATSAQISPETHSNDNSFTYLFTPRYRLGPDLMAYARIASGYQPGGSNFGSNAVVPLIFAPDKTHNYEVGAKGALLDRRLSLDASVFRILWHDIQLFSGDQTGSYVVNGSRAESDGVELSLTAKPLSGLTMSGWAVWNEAKLTEPLPVGPLGVVAVGSAGDPLPYSSRFSGYVSATEEVPLWADVRGFFTASSSYVGSRKAEFSVTRSQRQTLPAYAKTDMQLGMRSEQWQGTVFVMNVTDRRGYLDVQSPFPIFHIIQPRTMGFNVSLKF